MRFSHPHYEPLAHPVKADLGRQRLVILGRPGPPSRAAYEEQTDHTRSLTKTGDGSWTLEPDRALVSILSLPPLPSYLSGPMAGRMFWLSRKRLAGS